jgi:Tfp pilus assembly protein PilN
MINLLPGDIKEQIAFSKRNKVLLRYVRLSVFAMLACTGLLGFSYLRLRTQQTEADKQLGVRQVEVAKYKDLEKNAKNVNARIAAIKSIQATQSHFSSLLEDLGRVTPPSVVITSIALTGDDKKPVRISGTTPTLSAVAAFHDALQQKSARIAAADIENVGRDEKGNYSFGLSIAFKPGKAR